MTNRILIAAAAALFALPAYSAEIGIGLGSLTTGAGAAGVTGAQSTTQGGSLSTIAGLTAGGVRAGQQSSTSGLAGGQASCTSGPNCTSLAEQSGQSATTGGVRSGGLSLGLAGSVHSGQAGGVGTGVQAGQAATTYNFVNLFANP
jgi:hypothetical protein